MLSHHTRRLFLLLRMWWLARRVKSAMQEIETMRDTAGWLQEQAALHQRCIAGWCEEIIRLDEHLQVLPPLKEARHVQNV